MSLRDFVIEGGKRQHCEGGEGLDKRLELSDKILPHGFSSWTTLMRNGELFIRLARKSHESVDGGSSTEVIEVPASKALLIQLARQFLQTVEQL